MIAAIVAVDAKNAIGLNGGMLISIPEDLKMFREITSGHVVIMGRKTFEALPHGPLPNRDNVVITSKAQGESCLVKNAGGAEYHICGLETVKEWLSTEAKTHEKHHFIIGGGVIYKELLPFCERVYLTRIHKSFDEADTWFPDVDDVPQWQLTACSEMKYCGDIAFQFCVYDRIENGLS